MMIRMRMMILRLCICFTAVIPAPFRNDVHYNITQSDLTTSSLTEDGRNITQNGFTDVTGAVARKEECNIISHSGTAFGCRALFTAEFRDMVEKVVWNCGRYKYECDRKCSKGDVQVTKNGNRSTISFGKLPKYCQTIEVTGPKMIKCSLNVITNRPTNAELNIAQDEPAVLGGNVTLHINATSNKGSISWENVLLNSSYSTNGGKNGKYIVTDTANLITNVTENDTKWRFCNLCFCSPIYTLEVKDEKIQEDKEGIGSQIAVTAILLIGVIVSIICYVRYKYNYCNRIQTVIERPP